MKSDRTHSSSKLIFFITDIFPTTKIVLSKFISEMKVLGLSWFMYTKSCQIASTSVVTLLRIKFIAKMGQFLKCVFDHFVGLALKGLNIWLYSECASAMKKNTHWIFSSYWPFQWYSAWTGQYLASHIESQITNNNLRIKYSPALLPLLEIIIRINCSWPLLNYSLRPLDNLICCCQKKSL